MAEAVTASGAMTPFFGPVDHGATRFTDGGSAFLVPGRLLDRFGADYTIACSCVAGPASGKPSTGFPTVDSLIELTPLGRLRDFWVSFSFFLEESCRMAADGTHQYVEARPVKFPLLEMVRFDLAQSIVNDAREEMECKADEVHQWWTTTALERQP